MRKLVLLAVLLAFLVAFASADETEAPANYPVGEWNNWTLADAQDGRPPYWADGAGNPNIGICLVTGCNGALLAYPGTELPYYGKPYAPPIDLVDGATGFLFEKQGKQVRVEMVGSLTAEATAENNRFGWFEAQETGVDVFTIGALHELYDSAECFPSDCDEPVIFTPSEYYGFYFERGSELRYTLYPDPGEEDRLKQNFALFSGDPDIVASTYWLGVEDETGRRDYDDIVLKISSVPEPGSLMLLATGLLSLGGMIRRRCNR
jgi:hypothetical protein